MEGYQVALRDALTDRDPSALVRLRGELQIISRWLKAEERADAGRSADAALDAVSKFYQFGLEITGFSISKKAAERASFYDLASVGILAVENVLTAEKRSAMRFLMSGLSEGLMFQGSRQYVSGSEAVLLAAYRTHALAVQDALWSIAADVRGPENLESIREAHAAVEAVFAHIDNAAVPAGAKLDVLLRLYGLVVVIRCANLLEVLRPLA